MATDLSDYTDSLRRAVARPGEFARFFPNTSDEDLVGVLMDAVGEAQMDRFLLNYKLNIDLGRVTPDLDQGQIALLVLIGRVNFLRAELANRRNRTNYEARGNKAETEQSASIITQLLKDGEQRLKELRTQMRLVGTSTGFYMADLYLAKAIGYAYYVTG